MNSICIKENDYAIAKRGNDARVIQVSKTKAVFFCKQHIKTTAIIGQEFGLTYEIKDRSLIPVDKPILSEDELNSNTVQCVADNRCLQDDGKSQKLSRDEIEALKTQGTSGNTIVKAIVENSSSFTEKTQFSQQKYLKRKQKKYTNYVSIFKPNTRLIAELYFNQDPLKICSLRMDTLAQMLNYANIFSCSSHIVFDECLGLLVAGVLERLGDNGNVVQVYPGLGPVSSYRQVVQNLNFTNEFLENSLYGIPFAKTAEINNSLTVELKEDDVDEENGVKVEPMDETQTTNVKRKHSDTEEKLKRKSLRIKEQEKAVTLLKLKNLDSLLVVCKHHPTSVAVPLIQFLSPSRPFVIFSMFLEPLVDCYQKLKESGDCLFLKLTESWYRNYQILPDRTHPEINMSNTGGYLLTGIKVQPLNNSNTN